MFLLVVSSISLYALAQEKIDTSGYYPGDINYNVIIAAEKNYFAEVKRLIEKGAKVDAETWEGVTPLMYAVQNENLEIATYLLGKGANPDKKPLNKIPPLIAAVKTENFAMVELLIRNNASINTGDNSDITPLMYAAAFNNYTLTDMLLYYEAWVNLQDNNGNTALLIASYYGYFEIVDLLVQNGANVNLADNKGITPVYVAAQNGNTEIIEYLYHNGADIGEPNKYGVTPLYSAIQNKQTETSRYIYEKTDLKNLPQSEKLELMDLAVKQKNDSLIKLFKSQGLKINRKPEVTSCLLEFAMHFSSKDAFAGGLLGVNENKYKLYAGIGYFRRISPIAILDKKSPTQYYQFWEKRSIYSARLGRYFYLVQKNNNNLYIKPYVAYTLSTGRYKGTAMRPGTLTLFTPGIDLSYAGQTFGVSITYQYTDLKTYQIPDHRFGFSLHCKLQTKSNLKNSKKVLWYL